MLIGGWSVRTPAPVAAVVATGVIVFGLSACGGSSQTAHTPVATKPSVANCSAAQGIAAGEALVRSFSSARFLADSILAQSFQAWVSGAAARNNPGVGAPTQPLCALAREAAAGVVLSYAAEHETEIGPSPGAVVPYLRSHGVVCGSEC